MVEPKDILLEDLQHLRTQMSENEKIGQERVQFLLTLSSAVCAGLFALHTTEWPIQSEDRPPDLAWMNHVTILSLVLLLCFAVLTWLRLLRRDTLTDCFKRESKNIKDQLLSAVVQEGHIPPDDIDFETGEPDILKVFRGSYVQTTGFVLGAIVGGLVFMYLLEKGNTGSLFYPVSWGVAVFAATGIYPPWRRHYSAKTTPNMYFRAGVGAILLDADGHVYAFERAKIPEAWQFPQGGIKADETPEEAIWRELKEETGLLPSAVTFVAQYPDLLAYELPDRLQKRKTGRGQVQYWFVFRVKCPRPRFVLGDEFIRSRTMTIEDLVKQTAPFRRTSYGHLADFIGGLDKDDLAGARHGPSSS